MVLFRYYNISTFRYYIISTFRYYTIPTTTWYYSVITLYLLWHGIIPLLHYTYWHMVLFRYCIIPTAIWYYFVATLYPLPVLWRYVFAFCVRSTAVTVWDLYNGEARINEMSTDNLLFLPPTPIFVCLFLCCCFCFVLFCFFFSRFYSGKWNLQVEKDKTGYLRSNNIKDKAYGSNSGRVK